MGRTIQHNIFTVRQCLEQLRRHPMPELMDDDCLAALANIEAQYGDSATSMYGLEVRLGEEARYVDFILKEKVEGVPLIGSQWIEIDYEQFAKKKPEEACYFASVRKDREDDLLLFVDETMPAYAGEERARALQPALERLLNAMPDSTRIKQVGVMKSRGAEAALRLVLSYDDFDAVVKNLPEIGWPGDVEAFRAAFAPWAEAGFTFALAVDVFPDRIGEKIGMETYWDEKTLAFVDSVVDRLEAAGLCLPSKGAAVRRWERILPSAAPLIFNRFVYFKLNFSGGRITEAKAYLEGSSTRSHMQHPAYERPLRLDIELSDHAGHEIAYPTALDLLRQCVDERVGGVRFFGGEARESLPQLLAAAKEAGLYTEAALSKDAPADWLRRVIEAKPDALLVETATEDAWRMLETLRGLGAGRGRETELIARWYMDEENADSLPDVMEKLNALGVSELLITGMTVTATGAPAKKPPSKEKMKAAAKQIWDWRFHGPASEGGMAVVIETCFSVQQSMMASSEAALKIELGFERGCEGGRTFMAAKADGTFAPCRHLPGEPAESLAAYWDESESLKAHRASSHQAPFCDGCAYRRRCAPCPAYMQKNTDCPLRP